MSGPLPLALKRLLSSLGKSSPTRAQLSAFLASLSLEDPAPAAVLSTFPSSTILSLLALSNSPSLGFISTLLQLVRNELDRCWNASTGLGASRWGTGKAASGERWERALDELVMGIKLFVRGSDDRVVSDEEKIALGHLMFAPLAALLSITHLRLMIKRRVMDIFEYSTEHSPKNYSHLAQNATLGPAVLATILFEAKDQPLTERTLELAFRLGVHVAVDSPGLRATWAEHVFPESLWTDEEARRDVRRKLLSMTSRSFAEDSKQLLSVLSSRAYSCYRLIPALTLSANDHPFTNSDSELLSRSRDITYGYPVAFGADSFTAIVTGPPPIPLTAADEDDAPTEQILETTYSAIDRVIISSSRTIGRARIRLALLRAPSLDSEKLVRGGRLEEDEIVFEVESSVCKRLERLLTERGLSFETIDDTLPTPSSAPKKAPSAKHGSLSSLSVTGSDVSLTRIENVPVVVEGPFRVAKVLAQRPSAEKAAAPITSSPQHNQAFNSPTPRARNPIRVPPVTKRVPATGAAGVAVKQAPERNSLPSPAPAQRKREIRNSDPAGPGAKRASTEGEVDDVDGATAPKKARKSKVAFTAQSPTIIARSAILAPESDPTDDISFYNYQPDLVRSEKGSNAFSSTSYAPAHNSDISDGADSTLKVLEAKVAGMSRKQRRELMEMLARQMAEIQDGGDVADVEPNAQMDEASPARRIEVAELPIVPSIAITLPSPAIALPALPKFTKSASSRRRSKAHRPEKESSAAITKSKTRPPKEPRTEDLDPTDAQLATVLHELSDVFMKQFMIRRTGAHQAFNSSRLAIDRAARKVTKSLLKDSSNLLEAAHKSLEWPEKTARLEGVVAAHRAKVTTAREERAKA